MRDWRCLAAVLLVGCGEEAVQTDCTPGTVPCAGGCCELCLTDEDCSPPCSGAGDDGLRCVDGLCLSGMCCERTCAPAECGVVEDGCGGVVDCGGCAAGLACGAVEPYRCDAGDAPPGATCDSVDAECGLVLDGVSGVVDCGVCPAGQFCNGARVCCRSRATVGCHDGDRYWFDSCGDAEGAALEECPAGCQNGACLDEQSCTPRVATGCAGDDVVWLDSCGNPEAPAIESCPYGCDSGACEPPPQETDPEQPPCVPRTARRCDGNGLYWYDSCDVRGELAEWCDAGCVSNACVACSTRAERRCWDGDAYWYDSCGNREALAESCGNDSCGAAVWSCDGHATRVSTQTCVETGCTAGSCWSDTDVVTDTVACPSGTWCVEGASSVTCGDPYVRLTSPAAGAIWGMSESHRITWSPGGVAATVKLEYDTGSGWRTIGTFWNTGTYDWVIAEDPDDCTTSARIRITPNEGYGDTSDAFKIDCAPALTAYSPSVSGNSVEVNGVLRARCGELVPFSVCSAAEILAGKPVAFFWTDAQLLPDCSFFPGAHTYLFKGQYQVRLRAKNTCGQIAERVVTVTIP